MGTRRRIAESSSAKESRLWRCLKAPLRALAAAAELYVRSITNCGHRMATPTLGLSRAATSSSRSSAYGSYSGVFAPSFAGDDDFGELVRAASMKSLQVKQQDDFKRSRAAARARRSWSVAAGSIDEDKPCDFGADEAPVSDAPPLRPRSRSCAEPLRRGRIFW